MESSIKTHDGFSTQKDWLLVAKWLKHKYPQLTRKDLNTEKDDPADMLFRVGKRLGKIRPEVIQLITAARKTIQTPILAIKPRIAMRSNLMHDYYAVNSVDGRKHDIPLVQLNYFRLITFFIWEKIVLFFNILTPRHSHGKQI